MPCGSVFRLQPAPPWSGFPSPWPWATGWPEPRGENGWLKCWSTCRWCCRRWSSVTCCWSGFSPRGPVGSLLLAWFGVKVVFTWWAAAMASVVVSFPLMVRAMRLAFQGIDPRLEMAARSLGAGPLRSFLSVACRWPAEG